MKKSTLEISTPNKNDTLNNTSKIQLSVNDKKSINQTIISAVNKPNLIYSPNSKSQKQRKHELNKIESLAKVLANKSTNKLSSNSNSTDKLIILENGASHANETEKNIDLLSKDVTTQLIFFNDSNVNSSNLNATTYLGSSKDISETKLFPFHQHESSIVTLIDFNLKSTSNSFIGKIQNVSNTNKQVNDNKSNNNDKNNKVMTNLKNNFNSLSSSKNLSKFNSLSTIPNIKENNIDDDKRIDTVVVEKPIGDKTNLENIPNSNSIAYNNSHINNKNYNNSNTSNTTLMTQNNANIGGQGGHHHRKSSSIAIKKSYVSLLLLFNYYREYLEKILLTVITLTAVQMMKLSVILIGTVNSKK